MPGNCFVSQSAWLFSLCCVIGFCRVSRSTTNPLLHKVSAGMSANASHSSKRPPLWTLAPVVVFAVIALPMFVCLPLNSDTSLYDVQARSVLSGGVAYRDIVEPNLPGALWIHLAIRPVIGWSSEAMRLFYLAVFATSVLLLVRVVRSLEPGRWQSAGIAAVAGLFYVSMNEWCHCQRDLWMLLPVGVALNIRMQNRARGAFKSVLEALPGGPPSG